MSPDERIVTQKFLRFPDVHALTGLHRSHVHALAAQGRFPRPIKIAARASGWLSSEIEAWMLQRVAERDELAFRNRPQNPIQGSRNSPVPATG